MRTVTIDITIAKNGTKSIAVDGAQGTSCDALTKPLEDALSGAETDRENKSSYYDRGNEIVVGA